MKTTKKAKDLQLGDFVVIMETHLAVVMANWPQVYRPFNSIALRNDATGAVAELSVPEGLEFDVLIMQ